MKCCNCGEELPKGTLICPRCGTRQTANANSGGNGGNNGGGNNRKNSSGGNGNKKIIGLVAAVVLVVAGIVFGVLKLSKPSNEFFTHDITFDSKKLSVIDENSLRYLQVPDNKTFNVGTRDNIVDVKVTDNDGNAVSFIIDKTDKPDRYIVKPNKRWENTHIYTLSLGNNSYFTDEDMYKFKNVVFSIERDKEYSYKLNNNIKNLINNPNEVVEVGDIVTLQDEKGQYICKKISSKNGNSINYEDVALADVFEDLKIIDDNLKPDFTQLLESGDLEKNILMNFFNSNIFEAFVMTTYANNLDELEFKQKEKNLISDLMGMDNIASLSSIIDDNNEKKGVFFADKTTEEKTTNVVDQLIGNTKSVRKFENEMIGEFYISMNIDEESLRNKEGLKFKISVSKQIAPLGKETNKNKGKWTVKDGIKELNEIAEERYGVSDLKESGKDSSISLDITVGINPTISSNIDLKNYIFSINSYSSATLDLDFHGDLVYKHKFSETLKGNKRKKLDLNYRTDYYTDAECLLFDTPVTTPIPFVNLFFRASYVPEFTGEIDLKVGAHIYCEMNGGITFTLNNGFEPHQLVKKGNDKSHLHICIDGKAEMDFKFKFTTGLEVFVGVYVPFVGDIGVKIANANIYGKFTPFTAFEGKADIEFDLPDINDSKYKEMEIIVSIGAKYELGFEGELRIIQDMPGLSGEIAFIKGTLYIYQNKYSYKATESEANNIIPVGAEGSDIMFGPTSFKIIKKDDSKGIALLIANKGDLVRAYDDKTIGTNEDSLSGTWANSSLDKYLNEKYINEFDPFYRSCIEKVTVKAAGGGKDADNRKIFILSKEELENNKYLNSEEKRRLDPGLLRDFNINAKIGQRTDVKDHMVQGKAVYWIRDNVGKLNAMVVNSSGWINEDGALQSDNTIFVRPAFWVRYKDNEVSSDLKNVTSGLYGGTLYDEVEVINTLDTIQKHLGDRDAQGNYNSVFVDEKEVFN